MSGNVQLRVKILMVFLKIKMKIVIYAHSLFIMKLIFGKFAVNGDFLSAITIHTLLGCSSKDFFFPNAEQTMRKGKFAGPLTRANDLTSSKSHVGLSHFLSPFSSAVKGGCSLAGTS